MDENTAYLAGIVLGDGHIESKRDRIVISSKYKNFLKKLDKKLKFLGHSRSIFFDKSANVWKLSVYSGELVWMMTKEIGIPRGNKTYCKSKIRMEKDFIRQFLAGIYDAEGWTELDKGKYLKVRIKMKNRSFIKTIKSMLKEEGYKPTSHQKSEGSFVVDVNKRNDVKKFFETIPVLHPRWLTKKKLLL